MSRDLRQNTATRVTVGPFLDKGDGITPETGLTVTNCHLTLSVDTAGVPTLALNAHATASSGNNDMVHIADDTAGLYDLELTAAQLNYVGRAILAITDEANHCPVFHEFNLLTATEFDAKYSTGARSANITQILATALTETSGGYLAAALKKILDVATPVFTAESVNQSANNNTILASGTYGLSALKTLIDALSNVCLTGTINDAGASTTVFVTTVTGKGNDQLLKCLIAFTSGALQGVSRPITDYDSSTGTVTVTDPFPTAPANGASFKILGYAG